MFSLMAFVGGVVLAYIVYRGLESIFKQIFNKEKNK